MSATRMMTPIQRKIYKASKKFNNRLPHAILKPRIFKGDTVGVINGPCKGQTGVVRCAWLPDSHVVCCVAVCGRRRAAPERVSHDSGGDV